MAIFGAMDTAASGATVSRVWLDAISDNIANLNTIKSADEEPFRARLVIARAYRDDGGRGAGVVRIASKAGEPAMAYDPGNPLADEEGYILRPVVDLGEEMTNMLLAQRTYQANMVTVDRAQNVYRAALQIGTR
ncbi:MAG: flagellar basal body rod C-terminal domain-containing protein [Actinomycetota bacterium]|nr:flagellar basal body rod C-terminal domain-containing protein [Actinomycetota bacterium]